MRPQITDTHIGKALYQAEGKLRERLREKGAGILCTPHEVWGVMGEEWEEFKDAVEANDRAAVEDEVLDLAVAALVALASIRSGEMDW